MFLAPSRLRMTASALAILTLSACAGSGVEGPATPPAAAEGPCRNDRLDAFSGQKADAGTGAAILKASGARTLRWGGPGMAMTMDFRPDRVTVGYDEQMTITSARCG